LTTSDAILVGGKTPTAVPTDSNSSAVPTFTSGANPIHSDSSGRSVPRVVSGVVGGLVALTLLVLLALFFIRRQKRRNDGHRVILSRASVRSEPGPDPFTRPPSTMSQSSNTPLNTTWRNPGQSARAGETVSSERGFQNFGSRNTNPVLESSGNGHGGALDLAGDKSGQGFGRAFPDMSSGVVPPVPYSLRPAVSACRLGPWRPPPLGYPQSHRNYSSERLVIWPSPARTPVTRSGVTPSQTEVSGWL
jgi:hypothetical protein